MNVQPMNRQLVNALLATLLLGALSACGAPLDTGRVTLALQSPDNAFRLNGTVAFDRHGPPTYHQSLLLDGPEVTRSVRLPSGTYDIAMEPGWALLRLGTQPTDITHLVKSLQVTPNPVQVDAQQTSTVTITIRLQDDTRIVIGPGRVDIVLGIDESGLACGGCRAGEVCVETGSGTRSCVTSCDPNADPGAQCGLGLTCDFTYFSERGDGTLQPLYLCQDGDTARVSLLEPADGAVDIPPSISRVMIGFDRAMDRGTYAGNITLEDASGARAPSCVFNGENMYGFILCGPALKPATTYTVRVSAGVLDAAGRPLGTDYSFHFATAALPPDVTAPFVTGVDPADGSSDVPATIAGIRISFSEPMDRTTYSSLALTDSAGVRAPACAGSAETFYEFVLCGDLLKPHETYTITASTALRDLSGNALDPPFTSHFTTGPLPDDGQAPHVVAVDPADMAEGVSTTVPRIRVSFSEPMRRSTLSGNIVLTNESGSRVGACAFSGLDFYELVLCGGILQPHTRYTVTVMPGASDALGNPMQAPFSSSFVTGQGPL